MVKVSSGRPRGEVPLWWVNLVELRILMLFSSVTFFQNLQWASSTVLPNECAYFFPTATLRKDLREHIDGTRNINGTPNQKPVATTGLLILEPKSHIDWGRWNRRKGEEKEKEWRGGGSRRMGGLFWWWNFYGCEVPFIVEYIVTFSFIIEYVVTFSFIFRISSSSISIRCNISFESRFFVEYALSTSWRILASS